MSTIKCKWSSGGVSASIRIVHSGMLGRRPGRGASFSKPGNRSARNRSRHSFQEAQHAGVIFDYQNPCLLHWVSPSEKQVPSVAQTSTEGFIGIKPSRRGGRLAASLYSPRWHLQHQPEDLWSSKRRNNSGKQVLFYTTSSPDLSRRFW